jgi:hypothetical protein
MMAGSDSSKFDWLKRELEGELPASSGDPAGSLAETPPESNERPGAEEESNPASSQGSSDRAFPADDAAADLMRFPPPELNVSEGATLVIRNRDLDPSEDRTLPLAAEAALAYSPPEDQTAVLRPVDRADTLSPVLTNDEGLASAPLAAEAATDPGNFTGSTELPSTSFLPPPDVADTVLEAVPSPGHADEGHTEVLAAADLGAFQKPWPQFEAFAAAPFLADGAMAPAAPSVPAKPPVTESIPQGPSRFFILLASYASALTLAFIMLLLRDMARSANPHQLESLPDIPHEKVEKLSYVPPRSGLAPGHTLKLGESQRFGNILVEPLKITSEPVEFVHYSGNASEKLPPTKPVWKLWLKLTNVSTEQTIAPLDRNLVLRWVIKADSQQEFSNQYITARDSSEQSPPLVHLYHLPASSSWDMKGQDLGKTLRPGESYVTYLVSDESGLDQLPEDLVWRVQMRKGYSNKGNGVTTIFEVAFRKTDIVAPKTALAHPKSEHARDRNSARRFHAGSTSFAPHPRLLRRL